MALIVQPKPETETLIMEFTDLLNLIYENDIKALSKAKIEGIDFSITDKYDKNNLLIAYAGYGYNNKYQPEELIDFLINCGLDINHKKNKRGSEISALHNAVSKNNYKIISYLIEKGAQIDIQEGRGNTPLWIAVMNYRGNEEELKIINLLILKGASLNIKNFYENSVEDAINTIGGGIDAGHNKKEWDLRHLL